MRYFILAVLLCFSVFAKAQSWTMLGTTLVQQATLEIKSVVCDSKGNVYTAGDFNNLAFGGNGGNFVNKWDGIQWTELGGLNALAANNTINKLYCDFNDNIYAAGRFTNLNGSYFVAKWNGVSWQELGGLNALASNGPILSICGDSSGNIYAAGYFKNSTGTYYVAKWNGIQWSELGGLNALSANNIIGNICCDFKGNVYAAGMFTNSSANAYVAKWDGFAWTEVGGQDSLSAYSSNGKTNNIYAICVDSLNNLYVSGGIFSPITHSLFVAKFDGKKWTELCGINHLQNPAAIHSICSDKFGNIYVEGNIKNNLNNYYVQQFNGTIWQELGGYNTLMASYGIGNNIGLNSVTTDQFGNIYVAMGAGWHWYVFKYGNYTQSSFISDPKSTLLHLFPNPATNEIAISNPSAPKVYTILSINGQLLKSGNLETGTQTIDVADFSNGIYLLKTTTATYKFSVVH